MAWRSFSGAALAALAFGAYASDEPYSSTYQAHLGPPIVILNATVLDGTGRRTRIALGRRARRLDDNAGPGLRPRDGTRARGARAVTGVAGTIY